MKSYQRKLKNKRVILCYNDSEECFYLQFKRLKSDDELITENLINTTATVRLLREKLVITTIKVSKEIGLFLYQNFNNFLSDAIKGEYPSWLNCR